MKTIIYKKALIISLIITIISYFFVFLDFIRFDYNLNDKLPNPIISVTDFNVNYNDFYVISNPHNINTDSPIISEDKNYQIQQLFQKLQETITYERLLESSTKENKNLLNKIGFNLPNEIVDDLIKDKDFNVDIILSILITYMENGIYKNNLNIKEKEIIKNKNFKFRKESDVKEIIINEIPKKQQNLTKAIINNISIANVLFPITIKDSDSKFKQYKKGEIIVDKDIPLSEINLFTIEEYKKQMKKYPLLLLTNNHKKIFGFFGLLYTSLILMFYLLETTKSKISNKLLLTYSLFLILQLILTESSKYNQKLSIILIPSTFIAFLLINITTRKRAFILMFFQQLFTFFISKEFFLINFTMTSSIFLSISILEKKDKRLHVMQCSSLAIFFSFIGILLINLFANLEVTIILKNLVLSLSNIITSIFLANSMYPLLQNFVEFTSRERLFQLLDFENPLLKSLSEKAQGTYHHSLVVGNIAESIAKAIGANPLLTRVGSYYHDIGKLNETHFFIENSSASPQFHDLLEPKESANKIRRHVQEGIILAKKHKIPKPVTDIIAQHHGTSKIKYFLDKAEKKDQNIDITDFLYFGPKPQSKEAAIVMISDIVESTTKSMKTYTTESIDEVVNQTINNLIDEKQLIESTLTLKDLEIIREKMTPIIKGIYRKRIEYPNEKKSSN